jgi:hypothetical protein
MCCCNLQHYLKEGICVDEGHKVGRSPRLWQSKRNSFETLNIKLASLNENYLENVEFHVHVHTLCDNKI